MFGRQRQASPTFDLQSSGSLVPNLLVSNLPVKNPFFFFFSLSCQSSRAGAPFLSLCPIFLFPSPSFFSLFCFSVFSF
jgi:hypothetical protein